MVKLSESLRGIPLVTVLFSKLTSKRTMSLIAKKAGTKPVLFAGGRRRVLGIRPKRCRQVAVTHYDNLITACLLARTTKK